MRPLLDQVIPQHWVDVSCGEMFPAMDWVPPKLIIMKDFYRQTTEKIVASYDKYRKLLMALYEFRCIDKLANYVAERVARYSDIVALGQKDENNWRGNKCLSHSVKTNFYIFLSSIRNMQQYCCCCY